MMKNVAPPVHMEAPPLSAMTMPCEGCPASEEHAALLPELLLSKPFLDAQELARMTPWSVDAIDAMVRRGVLRNGVHWIQIPGRRERTFLWSRVVKLLKGEVMVGSVMQDERGGADVDEIPMLNGGKARASR